MSVLQKKRLLHLFVDTLTEGVCPELAMVSSTLKVEPMLVDVDPGTAMNYLKSRVTTTTTTTTTITSKSVVEEHHAWLASRRPLPPGPSQNVQRFSDSRPQRRHLTLTFVGSYCRHHKCAVLLWHLPESWDGFPGRRRALHEAATA